MTSLTARAPACRSAPMTFRTRKSPRSKRSRCSSITRPRGGFPSPGGPSPLRTSRGAPGPRAAPTRDGLPAPRSRCARTSSPRGGHQKGRQPWETTVSIPTPGPRITPTAPEVITCRPAASRLPPGPRAPEAIPPMTGRPGWRDSISSRNCSTGSCRDLPSGAGPSGRRGSPWAIPRGRSRRGSSRRSPAGKGALGDRVAGGEERRRPWISRPRDVDPRRIPWRAAEENQGVQHLGHDPEGVLESTGMRGGDEDHSQVRAWAEALQDRAGHLPYGVCGDGILAYGCGKGHPTAR